IEDSLNRPIASGIGGTQDTYLCVSASDTATGLAKLEIYKDGNIWFADTGYCGYLKEAGLYTIKACDKSGNCAIREIRIGSDQPPPNPFEEFFGFFRDFLGFPYESENLLPHDPNAMYGPEGQVTPGQAMSYIVEFENEGQGIAYGVYITDMFDKNLDDSNLIVKDFYLVDWETKIETPAVLPYNYDHNSKVLTVLAGDFGPNKGGKFTVELKLKNETPIGTIIQNKAIVYFPTVFEETHTNTIVSIVPSPTNISYTGDIAAQFSDFAKFQANVSADNKPLSGKKINFKLAQTTYTVLSNMANIAEIHKLIDLTPNNYEIKTEFPGDNFYYLSSSRMDSFNIEKEKTVLSAPRASVSPNEDINITITMKDDDNSEILLQAENPKTIYLDILENGAWKLIAQSLLSKTTAGFEFPFPQPLKLSKDIRARFDGDAYYESAAATGTISIIDNEAPAITIHSPQGGEIFAGAAPFQISFDITDNADPAPAASAYLNHLTDGIRIEVSNGDSFTPINLSPGTWVLTVEATDWAQNSSFITTSSFEIVADALPPRTEITIGEPKYGTEPVYISSAALISFTAQDDMFEILDNQGLGVDKTVYSIGSGDYTDYLSDFNIMEEGPHHLNYYSADVIGNIENVKTSAIAVDNTAPVTNIFIGEPKFNLSDGNILISSSTLISLTAADPLSHNIASGIKESHYRIDEAAPAVYISSFTIAGSSDGIKNIYYYSDDNVLNQEITKSATVILDNTPPISFINSPKPQLQGIDKIFNKELSINISVSDEHLKNYKLEIAEGENAEANFNILYESTSPANNKEIYTLNTKDYSQGYYSIKLEAEDFAGNRAIAISNIYIGKPQIELIIEGLNKPEGAAADKLGNIYISDTQKNIILKLNQTGEILAKFSGIDRNTKEKGLKNPVGIAVDDNFDIYIADRDNHRIAIMNQYGSIIKTIGKTNPKGKPIPGKKEEELHSPTGVAVSIDRIIAADKDSIKIFDKNADFLFEITDDGKRKYFDIAIDAQGNIYATDTKNNKVLMYDKNGEQINAIDDLKEPKGIDASEYIYAADEKSEEIFKYDTKKNLLLEFDLKRPYALALDKESNLYITDREKGKLHKFVLNPQASVIKIKLKSEEKHRKTEEERIKNRNGKIFVNAEVSEIVQIKVYDSYGQETDFKDFSAPKDVKGVFKYTYSLKEASLNSCEIKLFSDLDSDLVEYNEFKNCAVIVIELK
ncbi:MAG: NHL repeat-containing protein, partial [Elusimicrobia bacterium]|nr:NHL repeat-containing protein [Elusimicrobiota bacterium]